MQELQSISRELLPRELLSRELLSRQLLSRGSSPRELLLERLIAKENWHKVPPYISLFNCGQNITASIMSCGTVLYSCNISIPCSNSAGGYLIKHNESFPLPIRQTLPRHLRFTQGSHLLEPAPLQATPAAAFTQHECDSPAVLLPQHETTVRSAYIYKASTLEPSLELVFDLIRGTHDYWYSWILPSYLWIPIRFHEI
jgi:hypothetical protein